MLFEGWMLGFKPVPVDAVKSVDPQVSISKVSVCFLMHTLSSRRCSWNIIDRSYFAAGNNK